MSRRRRSQMFVCANAASISCAFQGQCCPGKQREVCTWWCAEEDGTSGLSDISPMELHMLGQAPGED